MLKTTILVGRLFTASSAFAVDSTIDIQANTASVHFQDTRTLASTYSINLQMNDGSSKKGLGCKAENLAQCSNF